jgi:enoyl-CoA hydratase
MLELGTDKLQARIERGIGFITLNNPERHNAVSLEMWRALGDVMEVFDADESVRVTVISGAGGRAFASGADISEFEQQRSNSVQRESYGEISQRGFRAVSNFSKPSIAMIQGYCLGGGLLLALATDLRFATAGSKFGVPATKLGLGYDYSGVAALARVVGPARTADLLFSARQLDAAEARESGLVNFVVPDGELATRVDDYARRVADNAPLTIRAIRASLRVYSRYAQLPDASSVEPLVKRCFDSEDYREGRRAFMEKRKPNFQGK